MSVWYNEKSNNIGVSVHGQIAIGSFILNDFVGLIAVCQTIDGPTHSWVYIGEFD
jgi:hypothetical protein